MNIFERNKQVEAIKKAVLENGKNKQIDIHETPKGECSRCGQCCAFTIPYTQDELDIVKNYVKKHNIKRVDNRLSITDKTFMADCCFCDKKNHKCLIYEVRPYVCKQFRCSHKDWAERNINDYDKRSDYNGIGKKYLPFDEAVYGDKKLSAEVLFNGMLMQIQEECSYGEMAVKFKEIADFNQRLDLLDEIIIPTPVGNIPISVIAEIGTMFPRPSDK